MAVAKATIDLVGRDKASGVLSKVSRSLSGFQSKLQGIGSLAKRVLLFGGLGAAGPAGFAIKAASDLEETMNKFNVVFADQARAVESWSDDFSKAVGRSKNQIRTFVSQAQDLFVPLGFAADEATKLSKNVTKLAIDIASFDNRVDEDVFRDLQSALTGNGEAVKKFGIILNETTVKMAGFNQGLDPKKLTNQQKVMLRWQIITKGSAAAIGDATRSAGSFANQLKRLKAELTNAAAKVGMLMLPAATKAVKLFGKWAEKIGDWVVQNKTLIWTVIKWAGAILGTLIILPKLIGLIVGLGKILSFLAFTPLGHVIIGLALVAAAMILLIGDGETFGERMKSGFGIVVRAGDAMLGSFAGLRKGLSMIWSRIVDSLYTAWDELWGESLQYSVKNALRKVEIALSEFTGVAQKMWTDLSAGWTKVTGEAARGLVPAMLWVQNKLGQITDEQYEDALNYVEPVTDLDRESEAKEIVAKSDTSKTKIDAATKADTTKINASYLTDVTETRKERAAAIADRGILREARLQKDLAELDKMPKLSDTLKGLSKGLSKGLLGWFKGLLGKDKLDGSRYGATREAYEKLLDQQSYSESGGGDPFAGGGGGGSTKTKAGSAIEGLTDLYSRISKAAAGTDPNERTADAAERGAKAAEKQVIQLIALRKDNNAERGANNQGGRFT